MSGKLHKKVNSGLSSRVWKIFIHDFVLLEFAIFLYYFFQQKSAQILLSLLNFSSPQHIHVKWR